MDGNNFQSHYAQVDPFLSLKIDYLQNISQSGIFPQNSARGLTDLFYGPSQQFPYPRIALALFSINHNNYLLKHPYIHLGVLVVHLQAILSSHFSQQHHWQHAFLLSFSEG